MKIIGIFISASFAGLALMHFFWALGGSLDIKKMIPEADNKPLFVPGVIGTVAVAIVLCCFAGIALALGFGGDVYFGYQPYFNFAGFTVGGVLILRAIGEFKYIGFFKRVRASEFAKYDTWLYSPFCLLAGCAFLYLAASRM